MSLNGVQMSPNLELEEALKDIGNKLASPPSDLQQLLLLLDKAEYLLSRVEQSPSASLLAVIRPAMKALIAKDLLGHSDLDVKVVIASCFSEITRITAPNAPYDDDLMKEIFGLIVGSFKNLDEMSSRSFLKRVSILETAAKVRSCVLMLDLECDDLILEMFHHFLKTIRSKHSVTIFSSMETIMTLVLEEAESISEQLLSCILDCLKNVETNILPAAKKLVEKVLVNCSLKLKPYLGELFNGSGALLSDYNKIVTDVFQGNLDTSMQKKTNASTEKMGSAQQEGEIFHPEISVAAADKSSELLMSNRPFQIGNGDCIDSEQNNQFCHDSDKSRVNIGTSLADSDILNSGTSKPDSRSDLSSRKRERNALLTLPISNDHYGVSNRKKARVNSGRRKGCGKEAEISQADGPSKELESAVCSKTEKKNVHELTSDPPDVNASVCMHTPNAHDVTRPRKSRLSQSSGKRNAVGKAAVGSLTSAGHKEVLFTNKEKILALPTRGFISNESEALGDLERKHLAGFTKRSRSDSAKDGKGNAKDSKSTPIATIDSDTKLPSNRGRNESQKKVRVNFLEKKQSAGTKQQIEVKHAEADDKELKLKELISSQKSMVKELVEDHNHVKDTNKAKSWQKNARDIQETFGPRKRRKGLDGTIVGSNIKIWWPDDQKFYDGIVDSFDQSTKMHRILYNDGDEEVLLLKKEQWEFIEGETKLDDGEKDKPDASASEILDSPGISGHLPKQRRRRRIKVHSNEAKSSSLTRRKSRSRPTEESPKHKDQTESPNMPEGGDAPKISRRHKRVPSKFRGKVVKDAPKPKSRRKSNGDSAGSRRRKPKNMIHISMKNSGVPMECSSMPESSKGRRRRKPDNGKSSEGSSPKPKPAEGRRRRKPGRMNEKAEGGKKPRIISNLNAKRMRSNSRLKLVKNEASPSGKKLNRAGLSK